MILLESDIRNLFLNKFRAAAQKKGYKALDTEEFKILADAMAETLYSVYQEVCSDLSEVEGQIGERIEHLEGRVSSAEESLEDD